MNGQKLQSALRDLQVFLLSPRYWLTVAVVVAVFTISGPFGTLQSMAPIPRLGFWLLLHGLAFAVAVIFAVAANALLAPFLASKLVRMMIGSALAALPIGFWIVLLQAGFVHDPITLAQFGQQVAVSVPLCLIFCVLIVLTTGTPAVQPAGGPASAAPASGIDAAGPPIPPARIPPLLARLRPENRGTILHLTVEDHYTAVTTARGQELVLLRFSDAMKELGDTDGLQVHRSHWVAKTHVERLAREDGRLVIMLKGGKAIPVSRTFAAQVRAAFS